MTTIITFTGAKGGVGTTTTAAIAALLLANDHGKRVALVSYDFASTCSVLAATPDEGGVVVVTDHLTVINASRHADVFTHHAPHAYDYIVIDGARDPEDIKWWDTTNDTAHHYLVTSNAYDSVRSASRIVIDQLFLGKFDGVILVEDPQRSLRQKDVEGAVAPVVATIHPSPNIARASDAGLLAQRRNLAASVVQLDNLLATLVPGAVTAR